MTYRYQSFAYILAAAAALLGLSFYFSPPATSAFQNSMKDRYLKSEYQIPMRDGKKLYAAVYAPKDTSQKYPILLNRTPYSAGPYGDASRRSLGPSPLFMRDGYIFVYQDVRG
ncbi:MAG: X-Pro dipeptidyl-peptidase, partial [Blastocatellia bacterium]|nr:X-Pro dipeptidyl-peptidase [Blastocatellia bacterium]